MNFNYCILLLSHCYFNWIEPWKFHDRIVWIIGIKAYQLIIKFLIINVVNVFKFAFYLVNLLFIIFWLCLIDLILILRELDDMHELIVFSLFGKSTFVLIDQRMHIDSFLVKLDRCSSKALSVYGKFIFGMSWPLNWKRFQLLVLMDYCPLLCVKVWWSEFVWHDPKVSRCDPKKWFFFFWGWVGLVV